MNKKISVIIPVYNSEKFLYKCLSSVVGQTLEEIEIIIVNDGSRDNSLEIINEFAKKDKRITVINKKNEGVSKARNAALTISAGTYILNIDSDDWIEGNYLEEVYKKAINENLDIVITDAFIESNIQIYFKDLNIENEKSINSQEYINLFFKENLSGYTWNKLIKKELYENVFYPENISLFEDIVVMSKLIQNAQKIGKINKAYYHYIENPNSISRNFDISKILDTYKCFKELKEIFKNNKKILILIKEQEIYALLMVIVNSPIYKINPEYNRIVNELLLKIKEIKVCNTDFKDRASKKVQYLYYKILRLFPDTTVLNLIIFGNKKLKQLRDLLKNRRQ